MITQPDIEDSFSPIPEVALPLWSYIITSMKIKNISYSPIPAVRGSS